MLSKKGGCSGVISLPHEISILPVFSCFAFILWSAHAPLKLSAQECHSASKNKENSAHNLRYRPRARR